MTFSVGLRIKISLECSWAKGAFGTIAKYPDFIEDFEENQIFFGDCWRLVKTLSGYEKNYWVVFDQPQYDEDGDGPYREAEFPEDVLVGQDI
jgi:hypothetical protein